MKAFVITILSHEGSVQASKKCIKSAAKYGLNVEQWKAITPRDKPQIVWQHSAHICHYGNIVLKSMSL